MSNALLQLDPIPNANQVGPGWIAAVVVLALIIGTFLLWRNMRKQLTKINFDDGSPTTSDDAPGTAFTTASAAASASGLLAPPVSTYSQPPPAGSIRDAASFGWCARSAAISPASIPSIVSGRSARIGMTWSAAV